jgi:hypothetical protein
MKKKTYRRLSQSVSTGEKVALDDACCLLAQELAPAQARSSWGGVDPVAAQDVPDRARGEREAEPGQFAVDALVAPARILRRQPEHELARLRDHRRPALRVSGEAPAAADELAMPAQKRRRLDEQRTHARQRPAECCQEDAVSRPQLRPCDLTAEHE